MTTYCKSCGCPIIDTYEMKIALQGHRDTAWQTAYTIACGCHHVTRMGLPAIADLLRANPDVAEDWRDYIQMRERAT